METSECFRYNQKLGISIPCLAQDWRLYSAEQQHDILLKWEQIRGHIPDRIKQLETQINEKQEKLNGEENFERSCSLNSEIADLASIINDLWLYYRTNQDVSDSYKNHL